MSSLSPPLRAVRVAFEHLAAVGDSGQVVDERMRSESMMLLETQARTDMPDGDISPRAFGNVKLDWSRLDEWTLHSLKRLGAAMLGKTHSLVEAYRMFDKHHRKFIGEDDFIEAAIELGVEGVDSAGAKKLFAAVDTNSSGRVNYLEFLDAFQVTDTHANLDSWKHGVVQQVANVLYQHRIHLKAAFRMFDRGNSGTITALEFTRGMKVLNSRLDAPLSAVQIEELRRALDKDGDGQIDYKEFFEGLTVADTVSQPVSQSRFSRRSSSNYMDLEAALGGASLSAAVIMEEY